MLNSDYLVENEMDYNDAMLADMGWDAKPPDRISFIGLMQQLVFNGNEIFENARKGDMKDIKLTAEVVSQGNAVTFATADAYLLTLINVLPAFTVYFRVSYFLIFI